MASLDRAEIAQIARNIDEKFTLGGYEIEPFCKETRGYLGTHSRLTLKVSDGESEKEVSCFVKTVEGGNLSVCLADAQVYEKEVFVYGKLETMRLLLENANVDVVAKLIYSNAKTQTLVLENLCEQGFLGKDELVVDEAHMLVVIEALAKFHSISIGYEEAKSAVLGRKYTLLEEHSDILEPMFCTDERKSGNKFIKASAAGAETLVDLIVDTTRAVRVKTAFKQQMEFYLDAINDTNNHSFRKVLSHGDLKGFNVLYKYENGKPIAAKLVDFQLATYTPPAHDLAMLIYVTSDARTFQNNVHKYYNHYYNCLRCELKKIHIDISRIISRDEFDTTCRLYMKAAKYTWLCYMQTNQSKEETFAKLAENLDQLISVVLGDGRKWYVKQNFTNDAVYKEVLTRILWDNIHYFNQDGVVPEDCFELLRKKLGEVDYAYLGHRLVESGNGKRELWVRINRDRQDEEIVLGL